MDEHKVDVRADNEERITQDKPIQQAVKEGCYYIGGGLWTHPETGGTFEYSNPADNR